MAPAAANRMRRGKTMKNGAIPSIANIITTETFWNHDGRWCAYHAVQGGRHWVS